MLRTHALFAHWISPQDAVELEVSEVQQPVSGTGRTRRRAAAVAYKDEQPRATAPTESVGRKRKKIIVEEPKRVCILNYFFVE